MADLSDFRVNIRQFVTFSDEQGHELGLAEFMARRMPDNFRIVSYFEGDMASGLTGYFLVYLLPRNEGRN